MLQLFLRRDRLQVPEEPGCADLGKQAAPTPNLILLSLKGKGRSLTLPEDLSPVLLPSFHLFLQQAEFINLGTIVCEDAHYLQLLFTFRIFYTEKIRLYRSFLFGLGIFGGRRSRGDRRHYISR